MNAIELSPTPRLRRAPSCATAGLVALSLALACAACGGGSDPPPPPAAAKPKPKPTAVVGSGSAGDGSSEVGTSLIFVSRIVASDLEVGSGPPIEEGQDLAAEYDIALTGGRVLERSAPGAPLRFTYGAGEILPGWEKGLGASARDKVGVMRLGGRRRILVPGEWGYGHTSWTGPVPAGVGKLETLVVTVRLVEIN